MKPLDQLKSVLCDPEGKCCIAGSDEDRAIVDSALKALAQPVQEPRPSFADVVRAEPTELIQKWRVLELYRAYEHCQFQATQPAQPAVPEPVAWSDAKQAELNDWFLSLPAGRQAVLLEDKWMLAGAAFLAGKSTPPAPAPLTDDQIWRLWWSRHDGLCGLEGKKFGEIPVTKAEFVAIVRSVLSYYGITKGGAA